jgi:hypothetical protein
MSWEAEEMATVAFGDQRLETRVSTLLQRLMSQPSASLPTACRGWDETHAAYRFFANPKVTAEKVLAPHAHATRERMRQHDIVLCIQDTTELDYQGNEQIQGLGPLTYEGQRGLYLHPTLAVTPGRLCLGVFEGLMWARREEHYGKKGQRKEKYLEEKESLRWIEGYRQVCELAAGIPDTQCIYMADRESDIYELFAEGHAQAHRADWLIRASHDRCLLDDARLSDALAHAPSLGELEFELPARYKRVKKKVTQTLKAVRVSLKAPKRAGGVELAPVVVSVLLAQERHPPKGEEPVTWILLTNLEIVSAAQAIEKIQWYLCRWEIEIYFRILKSGCKVEKLQLEHIDRLRPALALYMIVAWRVQYLTMLGRECPDLPCDLVFDTREWRAIYLVATRTAPPNKPPPLNTIIRMMAGFGGFLGRKGDGEPGPQTMWIGLQRTRDFVLALEASNAAHCT